MTDADDRASTIAALIEQGATPAEAAAALDVSERQARRLLRAAGAAPAPRGRPATREPGCTITIRIEGCARIDALDEMAHGYASYSEALADALWMQCEECGERTVLTVLVHRRCVRCRDR